MPILSPNRSLLNPKFEGYRLDPVAQADVVTRYELPYKLTQATVSASRSPISMQEVQSRITHNHLAISRHHRRALYIDSELRVVVVDVDQTTLQPSFRIVYELPKSIKTSDADTKHPEYPSAVLLSNTAFVSDGHGCLFILDIPQSGPGTLCGSYELDRSASFRIHSVAEMSPTSAIAIMSSRHYPNQPKGTNGRRKTAEIEFDLWAAQVVLPPVESSSEMRTMDICWRRRGEHVPISVEYDASRQAHVIMGGSLYRPFEMPAPAHYEPSTEEIAPIPRPNENLDTNDVDSAKPPSYSWTQSNDEVTIAFPLPSSTNKSDIQVSFSSRTLTVHVQTDAKSTVPLPHYSMKQLWDGIQTSTCFWTWDREAESSFGLLTLHLDKQNDGTRWMQVFASAGTSVSPDDESDIEVPETLDPSELWKIRESLEKYTSSLQDGEDASGLGLGRGVSSLADGEMDDEVDASVGRHVYITWVSANGTTLNPNDEIPFNLLSSPVPGINSSTMSVVVKNSLDGVAFSLAPLDNLPVWKHDSTFSALAFVLATKQDTRFTYHVPSRAVFAFENGTHDRGGNVYIYRIAPTSEKWAKQVVLKVGDGSAGSLLGVGALEMSAGKYVLLCLCERELVVIHDII